MGNRIQVKVEGPSGTYPLSIKSNATVRRLKKRYARAAREGVELEKVVLKYNDQPLDDEKTLTECSIQRNAVVEAQHVRVVAEEPHIVEECLSCLETVCCCLCICLCNWPN